MERNGHPDVEAAPEDFQEDCLHPRSPLMDCVAAILLCKQQLVASQGGCDAKALLKLQKICALFPKPSAVHNGSPRVRGRPLWCLEARATEEHLQGGVG